MRQELEDSINRLVELLRDDTAIENMFQQYFENNPVVFKVLGYSRAFPKPRFELGDGNWLEPDFLLERTDGLFEILDLKTPQEKLFSSRKKHRDTLYKKIDEYLSQIETYSEYFDDRENCEKVRNMYSFDIQKRPEIVIFVGKDDNLDKKQLHLLLSRRTHRPQIYTYDDVLTSLMFYHATLFGHTEYLSGLAWYALITLQKSKIHKLQYIVDIGVDPQKNRWSVYLDEHNVLRFEILDSIGVPYSISVPSGSHGFNFGTICHVICEFGNSDVFALMRILINNRTAAEQQFQFPINTSIDFKPIIGTDIEKKHFGSFTLAACAFYKVVPTFRQRAEVFKAMMEL